MYGTPPSSGSRSRDRIYFGEEKTPKNEGNDVLEKMRQDVAARRRAIERGEIPKPCQGCLSQRSQRFCDERCVEVR